MANKARGEVTLELGGETYVLRPEFGVIAEIEDELDTDMFRLGMRAEQFKFRVKELAHALRVVLAAHGHEVAEEALATAIGEEGVATVLVPLALFLRAYVWGGGRGKKDPGAGTDEAPSPPKDGKSRAISSTPA